MNSLTSVTAGGNDALPPDYAFTPEGLDARQTELFRLRERRARSGEGEPLLEDELILDARIRSLERVLGRAWVVDPSTLERDVVAIGATVGLEDLDSQTYERYRVVGKHEPLRAGELSAASAIGKALLGRRSGETVAVELPNGSVRRFRVAVGEPTRGAAAPAS